MSSSDPPSAPILRRRGFTLREYEWGVEGHPRVPGTRLRELFQPEKCRLVRDRTAAAAEAQRLFKKPFFAAQLRYYGLPVPSTAKVEELHDLLKGSVQSGKCDKLPSTTFEIEQSMRNEYKPMLASWKKEREAWLREQTKALTKAKPSAKKPPASAAKDKPAAKKTPIAAAAAKAKPAPKPPAAPAKDKAPTAKKTTAAPAKEKPAARKSSASAAKDKPAPKAPYSTKQTARRRAVGSSAAPQPSNTGNQTIKREWTPPGRDTNPRKRPNSPPTYSPPAKYHKPHNYDYHYGQRLPSLEPSSNDDRDGWDDHENDENGDGEEYPHWRKQLRTKQTARKSTTAIAPGTQIFNRKPGAPPHKYLGSYKVKCRAIEGEWPDHEDELTIDIWPGNFPDHFLAHLDFGIFEGTMVISEASGGGSATSSSSSAPSRSATFLLKGRETGMGMIYYQPQHGTLNFTNAKFTAFDGVVDIPAAGSCEFRGTQVDPRPMRLAADFSDFSERAYEAERINRWR